MPGMTEIERIRDQLARVFEGEAWHGTPIGTILSGVTAAQASVRPINGAHAIWEIVRHITAWQSIVRRRVSGETISEITDELNCPPASNDSESAWQTSLEELRESYRGLCDLVSGLSEEDLEREVVGKLRNYTVYQDLHGVLQHGLYHTGQIVMLLNALE